MFLSPNHPRVRRACRHNERDEACPKFLRFGDAAGPGPFIPPNFTTETPNLLVVFVLHEVTNTLVLGNGVGGGGVVDFRFEVDSPVSSIEEPTIASGIGYGPNFPPGTTRDNILIIWQSIVLGGCNSPPPVIPVDFRNRVGTQFGDVHFQEVGSFEAVDDTSLVPTGFWNFQYTVRAFGNSADVSDFRVRGKVSVVCTDLVAFP